uniref:IS66 family transposase zinc-finger binding domain-containing protein n=1 Tax=Clostridium estertheticum TaxID=238834 RepID=UPI00209B9262|nr:IS66 family transposase zinc-finger binding domain-containing protein [Clostridium estertheticum]
MPHEVIECILNTEESMCGICGSELDIIGKKKVRSEMEYIPARLIMKDYLQYVYKCVDCEKNDTNPHDSIICVPVPAPVLTHSFASPSCVAWVMYQKYMMSVPLYRQEKDFKRMVELKRE